MFVGTALSIYTYNIPREAPLKTSSLNRFSQRDKEGQRKETSTEFNPATISIKRSIFSSHSQTKTLWRQEGIQGWSYCLRSCLRRDRNRRERCCLPVCGSPGFHLQLGMVALAGVPALGRWRQKGQSSKIFLAKQRI